MSQRPPGRAPTCFLYNARRLTLYRLNNVSFEGHFGDTFFFFYFSTHLNGFAEKPRGLLSEFSSDNTILEFPSTLNRHEGYLP